MIPLCLRTRIGLVHFLIFWAAASLIIHYIKFHFLHTRGFSLVLRHWNSNNRLFQYSFPFWGTHCITKRDIRYCIAQKNSRHYYDAIKATCGRVTIRIWHLCTSRNLEVSTKGHFRFVHKLSKAAKWKFIGTVARRAQKLVGVQNFESEILWNDENIRRWLKIWNRIFYISDN